MQESAIQAGGNLSLLIQNTPLLILSVGSAAYITTALGYLKNYDITNSFEGPKGAVLYGTLVSAPFMLFTITCVAEITNGSIRNFVLGAVCFDLIAIAIPSMLIAVDAVTQSLRERIARAFGLASAYETYDRREAFSRTTALHEDAGETEKDGSGI